MDPRQPQQHPFSRNGASAYGRNPYTTSNSSQPPYSQSSHPSNSAPPPAFGGDHHRRPSDPPYSNYSQRQYSGEGAPMSGGSHSRHQSASSVGHGTPVGRGMPPPSSPQQRETQHNGYGPPPRAATASAGQPFTSGRELPALPPGRPGSTAGSSMSINSILGGPVPASREQSNPHYSPVSSAGAPNSTFGGTTHASPRMTAASDYATYRRPLTPELPRSYESRDHRANSAGSPPGGGGHYTPDSRRFGTPQNYGRNMPAEERREPIRVPNANSAPPPRPSSQPGSYNAASRPNESRPPIQGESLFGRRGPIDPLRVEPPSRDPYRRTEYDERQGQGPPFMYAERARQEREREATMQREREQRERVEQSISMQQEYAHQLSQRNSQAFNRPPERESLWMRHGYEPPRHAYEPIPEQAPHQREPLPGHDYPPRTTAPTYSTNSAHPNEHRYSGSSQPASASSLHSSLHTATQLEQAIQERQKQTLDREYREMQEKRQAIFAHTQNVPYPSAQGSPTRRQIDDAQQISQLNVQRNHNHLTVQEINRKGRVSPLPQAVQGAQGQISTPSGEPGIKSEFGRMFSGIGSGVGAMGAPSPITAGPQSLPNSAQFRRDELDSAHGQDSPLENGGYKPARSPSRGGRRRKLKDEDNRDDDSSTGRRTPSGTGRGKRAKSHHYLHHNHNHHHRRADPLENASSPSQSNITPFKNVSGALIPSPPDAKAAPVLHHHHVPRHHHHPPAKPAVPQNVVIPVPRTTIRSNSVLESVAHLPRTHLGHAYYQSDLKPAGNNENAPRSKRGFASTPQPLPNFEGSENCTFTVKIAAIHLTQPSREEITYRRAVWGTDIYTDDSDVVAACIHQGWFRGAWAPDVDIDLLDLEIGGPYTTPAPTPVSETEPPPRGPLAPPQNKDAHVTILVLPNLEQYSSTTRFGMRSREWGAKRDGYKGKHDGLSFMIMGVRWVGVVDDGIGRSKGARKKMIVRDLEGAIKEDKEWSHMFGLKRRLSDKALNRSAVGGLNDLHISESFERGGSGDLAPGEFSGVGMKHWWKVPSSGYKAATSPPTGSISVSAAVATTVTSPTIENDAASKEVESQSEEIPTTVPAPDTDMEAEKMDIELQTEPTPVEKTDIERVTERMVENATVPAAVVTSDTISSSDAVEVVVPEEDFEIHKTPPLT